MARLAVKKKIPLKLPALTKQKYSKVGLAKTPFKDSIQNLHLKGHTYKSPNGNRSHDVITIEEYIPQEEKQAQHLTMGSPHQRDILTNRLSHERHKLSVQSLEVIGQPKCS